MHSQATGCRVLLLSNANVYTDNSEAVAFRQAAWQAISVCGSDMSGGASLYEVLCDFECTNVQRLIEQHGATSDVAKNAAEVAHAVWEKRSSAALPGGEDVLRAYKKWNDALPDAGLRKPITDKLQKARFLVMYKCCVEMDCHTKGGSIKGPENAFARRNVFCIHQCMASGRFRCR